jgi:hypothetical protein
MVVSDNHDITYSDNHDITDSDNHDITDSDNHDVTDSDNHDITDSDNHDITEILLKVVLNTVTLFRHVLPSFIRLAYASATIQK